MDPLDAEGRGVRCDSTSVSAVHGRDVYLDGGSTVCEKSLSRSVLRLLRAALNAVAVEYLA
jgi:hypothetical protein